MIKEQILPVAVTVACTAVVLAVLWFYIRFAIISEYRTRGWKDRLPHPRLEEVEVGWGLRLPRQLEALYRAGGVAAMAEVYLAAPGPGQEHLELAAFLIEAGADVNARHELGIGNTALGEIAGNCSFEMARLLVDSGADPSIRGWMHLNALDRAERRKRDDGPRVYALLMEAAGRKAT